MKEQKRKKKYYALMNAVRAKFSATRRRLFIKVQELGNFVFKDHRA